MLWFVWLWHAGASVTERQPLTVAQSGGQDSTALLWYSCVVSSSRFDANAGGMLSSAPPLYLV